MRTEYLKASSIPRFLGTVSSNEDSTFRSGRPSKTRMSSCAHPTPGPTIPSTTRAILSRFIGGSSDRSTGLASTTVDRSGTLAGKGLVVHTKVRPTVRHRQRQAERFDAPDHGRG